MLCPCLPQPINSIFYISMLACQCWHSQSKKVVVIFFATLYLYWHVKTLADLGTSILHICAEIFCTHTIVRLRIVCLQKLALTIVQAWKSGHWCPTDHADPDHNDQHDQNNLHKIAHLKKLPLSRITRKSPHDYQHIFSVYMINKLCPEAIGSVSITSCSAPLPSSSGVSPSVPLLRPVPRSSPLY